MKNKKLKSIFHFSSHLPKRCGIATYIEALKKSISIARPDIKNSLVVINDKKEGYKYPSIVKYHFWDKDKEGYKKAAQIVNDSDAQIVNAQHEFGLYGARVKPEFLGKDDGKNFLVFLNNLKKPVITTMHMVYQKPPKHHLDVVKNIFEKSKKIVVLSRIARRILINPPYNLSRSKIVYIPHGAPNVPKRSTNFYKHNLGYDKKSIIISSFGYVRSKKGYEYLIEAISLLKDEYPNIKLLLIGEVHPQRSPEYFAMLKALVKKLKLERHVEFINKFVDYTMLLNYLMATNIFVAPFLVMYQVSSGTLIYAMATGRVCIATPFDYAREALADKRGILVPLENSKKISEAIKWLIKHPKARHRMENKAYQYARTQIWSKTAKKYIKLFEKYI